MNILRHIILLIEFMASTHKGRSENRFMILFPAAKFLLPPLPSGFIAREAIIDKLRQEFPNARFTLFIAPPGYGKTTTMALLPTLYPDYWFVWIALGPEDNDPILFLAALGKGLAPYLPQFAQYVSEQLELFSAAGSDVGRFLFQQIFQTLIAACEEQPKPIAVLLDDLHCVDHPVIFEGLNYLFQYGGGRLHIAATTRQKLPMRLNYLRARRQLLYFDLEALRFDLPAMRQFVAAEAQVPMNETQLRELYVYTEGWPAGLLLSVMRLNADQELPDKTTLDTTAFDYFAEEIFAQLPEAMQTFLLEIGILDEIAPSMCEAITGQSNALQILEELRQRNLFLLVTRPASAEQEPLYRFHTLFALFLRGYLKRQFPERFQQLIQFAAAQETPMRALPLYLDIKDWDAALALIEEHGEQWLEQGMQATLLHWLNRIPATFRAKRPKTLWEYGYAAFFNGNIELALQCFSQANSLVAANEQLKGQPIADQTAVALGTVLFALARFQEFREAIGRLHITENDPYISLNYLMLSASLATFLTGEWSKAAADLQQAITLAQASGEEQPRLWYQLALYLGPEFMQIPNGQSFIAMFCNEVFQSPSLRRCLPLQLAAHDAWSGVCLRMGNIAEAANAAQTAIDLQAQLGGYTFLGSNSAITLAIIAIAQEKYALAENHIELAMTLLSRSPLTQALLGGGWYFLGRLRFLQKRYVAVKDALQALQALPEPLPHITVLTHILAALYYCGVRQFAAAEQQLLIAQKLEPHARVSGLYGSVSSVFAYVYSAWRREELSQEYLRRSLNTISETDQGSLLLDIPLLLPLLREENARAPLPPIIQSLCDSSGISLVRTTAVTMTLTQRQLEILRCIAAGNSNQEIAEHCSLTLATVKSHIVHIMDRLGARSRTEAVAIARTRRIIG